MEKLNIGIIGCGLISKLHAIGYEDNPRVRLYAICDVDEELVTTRRREWKVERAFTDYRELLADPDVDAVEVITPHKLHEQIAIDALGAKKHVAVPEADDDQSRECRQNARPRREVRPGVQGHRQLRLVSTDRSRQEDDR
jgi:predicted dinucleotide-utilizing enzyme